MMNKVARQLRNIAAGVIASAGALSLTAPSAMAYTVITIAGVQQSGGQTTFVSLDPAFGLYPAYQLQPASRPIAAVGVNFPALGQPSLAKTIGKLDHIRIFYEVPSQGPSADPGLRYYLQTSDGFLHSATAASKFSSTSDSFNVYENLVKADLFAPALTATVSSFSLSYTRSAAGNIYVSFPTIKGSKGKFEWNLPDGFSLKTNNDKQFNN
jgi:hypothetical protein